MAKRALLFPGQGSQYIGMAMDLAENSKAARSVIEDAEAVIPRISAIMFSGPAEELKQTNITQPALYIHSAAVMSLIPELKFEAAAGHSLGEYSALTASGAIDFKEGLKLVRARGEAMLKAGIENPGTMAAVVGLESSKVDNICKAASSKGIVQPANYNSPGQIVISGSVDGVKEAMKLSKEAGAKLVKELIVSGAFHSPLMESAKELLKSFLDEAYFSNSEKPVYSNVTAKPLMKKEEITDALYKQVTSPVRWMEIIKNMSRDGITEFYEIGAGKVLQGLVKRINPDAKTIGIDKYSDLERIL